MAAVGCNAFVIKVLACGIICQPNRFTIDDNKFTASISGSRLTYGILRDLA